jgi:transcriptional regulator with XRE-family HTH domain
MGNIMPSKLPKISSEAVDQLIVLGQQIRAHRKELRISATAAAEAAGMSRVTLHRIEKGEPAVTMGAYVNAMAALGLNFGLVTPAKTIEAQQVVNREGWIPARIPLIDYPQLKQLAWQVHGTETLSPTEAWDIYERNWRHMDEQALTAYERQLMDGLRLAFGGIDNHV